MEKIVIGKILKPHGIKGDVIIRTFCQNPLDLKRYNEFLLSSGQIISLKILKQISPTSLLARINDCSDRTSAETFRSLELTIQRNQFPSLSDPDEFYIQDLIGLTLIDKETRNICGKVSYVHNFGAGTILEIIPPLQNGKRESSLNLPFHHDAVDSINLDQKTIFIDSTFLI